MMSSPPRFVGQRLRSKQREREREVRGKGGRQETPRFLTEFKPLSPVYTLFMCRQLINSLVLISLGHMCNNCPGDKVFSYQLSLPSTLADPRVSHWNTL